MLPYAVIWNWLDAPVTEKGWNFQPFHSFLCDFLVNSPQ